MVPPNFVKFFIFFVLAYPENFMRLAWVARKFEFWWPRLRGTLSLWYPQILSYFIYFEKFICVAWVVTKFEFWLPHFSEPSQLIATNWPRSNWPRSNVFITCFRHWFHRSDFATKWGFGQDGSGDSKNIFRIALPSQSALFAVSLFTVSWFAVSCRGPPF